MEAAWFARGKSRCGKGGHKGSINSIMSILGSTFGFAVSIDWCNTPHDMIGVCRLPEPDTLTQEAFLASRLLGNPSGVVDPKLSNSGTRARELLVPRNFLIRPAWILSNGWLLYLMYGVGFVCHLYPRLKGDKD